LAVEALGHQRVLGLAMPEDESDPLSLELAEELATVLNIELRIESIGPMLRACGCYARREAAVQRVIPEFSIGWRFKLVIAPDHLNVTYIEAVSPAGEWVRARLPSREYREIVAATNFKQRIRKMMEYFHADRLHYAVVGTPNRLEYDQGFFVKGGDGLADVKPIAHLYKSQVYELAALLNIPERIINRTPTTDTYSLPQSQEEFYFALRVSLLEKIMEAHDQGAEPLAVARALGLEEDLVRRAFRDIEQKRLTTRYLHMPPLLVDEIGRRVASSEVVA
jgi:NAD+ synthase